MNSTTTIATVASKISAVINRGAWSGSISTSGGNITVPAGYHNGSGKVTGPTLASLVGGNATLDNAANLLSGYTAYGRNGTKYSGTHVCKTLAQLVGTTVTLDSNSRMLASYTAYGKNGTKYTGSIVTKGDGSTSVTTSGKYGYDSTHGFWVYVPANAYYTTAHWINVPYAQASALIGQAQRLKKKAGVTNLSEKSTFSATVGKTYVAAMGGDPGDFQNFSVSGATILSNITSGNGTPPHGSTFVRMVLLKATSTSVTINWGDICYYIVAEIS